jgi:hypothetical protein
MTSAVTQLAEEFLKQFTNEFEFAFERGALMVRVNRGRAPWTKGEKILTRKWIEFLAREAPVGLLLEKLNQERTHR